jgi:hypothetical protein
VGVPLQAGSNPVEKEARFHSMSRPLKIDRTACGLILLGAALFVTSGCAPRKKAPQIRAATGDAGTVVRWVQSDASVDVSGSGSVNVHDPKNGFQLTVPAGWTANTSFAADESGPPAAGTLRVRLAPPKGACVVDVAVEPWPGNEDALRASLPRGRELFFFAKNEEPRASLANAEIWTATLVPLDPARIDVGYWIHTPSLFLRVEGRFHADQVSECKQELDAIVGSLAGPGDATPKASL